MLQRWLSRALLLTLFGVGGCPMVLDDNFESVPGGAGAVDTGGGGAGTGIGPDEGGAPDNGGASAGGPVAGKGPVAGGSTGGSDSAGASSTDMAGAAGAAEGGAPNTSSCVGCEPEACCEGVCVDLAFDAKNCHTCGHGCPGTTCSDSSCTNSCAQGYIDCNKNVADGCEVNSAVDPDNCGNCGIVCGFGLDCVGGNCVCPKDTADCDGLKENGCEADTSSDPTRCGGCGKACNAGQRCVESTCSCQVDFADCNLQAVDGCEASLADQHSCGSCQLDCGAHSNCVSAGTCACAPGYLDCDSAVPGCETPITDSNHCGSCTTVCPAGAPACDGTSCSAGCGALTRCGSSCVDTKVDLQNCGACGNVVGLNQTCVAGEPVCVAGYGDCDANPGDCEVNTDTDANHCGSCPSACKPGALCTAGTCACAPTTPNDCGASCAQCCNDGQCSDGDSCTTDVCSNGQCGAGAPCDGGPLRCCAGTGCFACCGDSDCPSGKICSGNQCIKLTCPVPQIVCNNSCVNPTNDANNCSSCDQHCGKGRTCSASACSPKWVTTAGAPSGFVARERAAFTAMGSKVFVWGGIDAAGKYLSDGAIYDPDADTWANVGTSGSRPAARTGATAVWTGAVVVVWGGGNASTDMTSGSRYDPVTDSWQAISTVGAPTGRRGSAGFWTGSRVLIYGGFDRNGAASAAAGLYDPVNDTWTIASSIGQPLARLDPTTAWTGSLLLVYGGNTAGGPSARTYTYSVASNLWTLKSDGPSARFGSFGAWDGTYFTAWSGGSPPLMDGKIFDPAGNKWTNMSPMNQPSPRWAPDRQTGWSARVKPGVTLFVGGFGAKLGTFYTNGGLYNSTTNSWAAVPAWPSGFSHIYGVGVWSGSEFVVWGGRTGTGITLTAGGERYRP